MFLQLVFALLVAALAPPSFLSLQGGGDLDLPGAIRVSWFEPGPFTLGLLAAVVATALTARGRRLPRLLLAISAGVLFVLAYVAWAGSLRTPWLRVTDAWLPALEACVLIAIAILTGARPLRPLRAAWFAPACAMLLGGLALLAFVAADHADLVRRVLAPREPRTGRDLIFVLVDTLRADALGVYGASPSPSPWLDAHASRAMFFERAVAQAPWTYASVTSFMTSRHPSSLKLHERPAAGDQHMPALDPAIPRLADVLRGRGYRTAGFYTNPFLGPGSGVDVGFDVYEFVGGPGRDGPTAGWVVDAALQWGRVLAKARAAGDRNPAFLYLHFMEPHLDYQPPRAFWTPEALAYRGPLDGSSRRLHKKMRSGVPFTQADLAFLRALYQGEVAYLDTELRRLEGGLRALGLWREDTVFVLTGDHGEQLGEHGEFEHGDVHAENVHVPLWIESGDLGPRSVADVVRLLDLTPTLLDLLGERSIEGAEGRSLMPLARGEHLPPLPAFTEYPERFRVTTDRLSLLLDHGSPALYDWPVDSREITNLVTMLPDEASALRAALDAHQQRPFAADAVERPPQRSLDPATRDALKALGYL